MERSLLQFSDRGFGYHVKGESCGGGRARSLSRGSGRVKSRACADVLPQGRGQRRGALEADSARREGPQPEQRVPSPRKLEAVVAVAVFETDYGFAAVALNATQDCGLAPRQGLHGVDRIAGAVEARLLLALIERVAPVELAVRGPWAATPSACPRCTPDAVTVRAGPNRQGRERHGKTGVVDAIAAARAVLWGRGDRNTLARFGKGLALPASGVRRDRTGDCVRVAVGTLRNAARWWRMGPEGACNRDGSVATVRPAAAAR